VTSKTSVPVRFLTRSGFAKLLDVLVEAGYELIGPTVRAGVVVFDQIEGTKDLPRHIEDEQGRGSYRLRRNASDDRFFGFTSGPDSAKRWLFPPGEVISDVHRNGGHLDFDDQPKDPARYAFVGLRSCDLRAIAVQDRVFSAGAAVNESYIRRRENAFFIAVNCTRPSPNCFCASMGSGPRCADGYDLALTELDDGFVVEVGSVAGRRFLTTARTRPATADECAAASAATEATVAQMQKSVNMRGLPEVLYQSRDSSRWEEIAEVCLSCGNCTAVCPTCFCHDIVDGIDLSGTNAARTREWATCFSLDFSRAMGTHMRASGAARYRQWLTHKFASWFEQFGEAGCVGCGRCITWCPAGIDITELLALLAADAERDDGEVNA
jgi:ferredoxin